MIFPHFIRASKWIVLMLFLSSCGILRKPAGSTPETAIMLDTVDFLYSVEETLPLQLPPVRKIDVLHTELDLSFDLDQEAVLGQANLTITAYNQAIDTISLNARGFEIVSIHQNEDDSLVPMLFHYDGTHLNILPKASLSSEDTLIVQIDYKAFPTKLDRGNGSAITSAQGLYFIDPSDENPLKPTQIWSQGETNYNSGWFPCVDHPHEKFTQEVFLTVDERFQTLSNGKLVYSSQNENGTRTDYWKQDLPHSTYLTMIAVGNWSVIKDQWRDMPVWYYIDSTYEEHADAIFGNTPEMIAFYSERLGFDYPWDKYHQVVVEDFVSGAMENTSAVIHGDFVQLTERELLDESHEDVVAHELFHHWFGDVVTAESWAHITMNEGFATYGEYLWMEHKYGKDAAQDHLRADYMAYLSEASMHPKSLIRYRYDNPDDVFDRHSYQKGGLVIHMLREELGDKVFFKGLKRYLNERAFKTVEVDHLRQALEEESGRDLRWFFDDWFFQEGHPEVHIQWELDSSGNQLSLSLEQEQEGDALFRNHVDVVIAYANQVDTHRVWVDEWAEHFSFLLDEAPTWYAVDPDHALLWERHERKPDEVWLAQIQENHAYFPVLDGVNAIDHSKEELQEEYLQALRDKIQDTLTTFSEVRVRAVEGLFELDVELPKALYSELKQVLAEDPNSHVRAIALRALDSLDGPEIDIQLVEMGLSDTSFHVMRTALSLLLESNPCAGLSYTESFSSEEKKQLMTWLSRLHANCGNLTSLRFFQQEGLQLEGFEAFLFYNDFSSFAQQAQKEEVYDALVKQLEPVALESGSWWARLSAIQSMEKAMLFYESTLDELLQEVELTSDQTEHIASLRNKKASLSAAIEEARELQGDDEHFIDQ